MTEQQLMEMIRNWSDSRLLSEIDQAAAAATDLGKTNEQAFSAAAAVVLLLKEKYRRELSSNFKEVKPTRPKLTEEQFQAFLRGFDQADQELSSNSKPTPPEQ